MFYQTQLSKIGAGGAIDTQGKRLRFCGNLPVSVGDWVWTDGAVIFGHVPIRDSPLLPSVDGGIPAAFSNSKGFYSKTGRFKNYPIAVEDATPNWIVNGRRKYFHSDAPVFDAEISINENGIEDGLFTAELAVSNSDNVALYCVDGDAVLNDDAVVIKKDGTEISRVYLRDMAQAFIKIDEIKQEYPYDGFYLFKGRAQLLNFQLHTDGTWDALVISSVQCSLKYSSIGYSDFPEYDSIWRANGYSLAGDSSQEKYFGYVLNNLNEEPEVVSATYNNYLAQTGICQFKAEEFRPLWDAPTMSEWFSKPPGKPRNGGNFSTTVRYEAPIARIDPPKYVRNFHRFVLIYYLVHLNSKGIKNVLQEEFSDSSVEVYRKTFTLKEHNYESYNGYHCGTLLISEGHGPIWFWVSPDDVRIEVITNREILFQKDEDVVSNVKPFWRYPLQDEFFCQMNFWRILNVYDPDGNSIVINFAQSSDDTEQKIDVRIPEFRFVREDIDNVRWFLENDFKLPYIILPAVAPLKNGGYLIGVPQYAIYKVDATGIAKFITDKNVLANLRLRYMPNISKARH